MTEPRFTATGQRGERVVYTAGGRLHRMKVTEDGFAAAKCGVHLTDPVVDNLVGLPEQRRGCWRCWPEIVP